MSEASMQSAPSQPAPSQPAPSRAEPAPAAERRHDSPYGAREKVARLLWGAVQATLFRLSFHNFYGWRRFLLRSFGATIDDSVHVMRTAKVTCPWNLAMGRNSCLGEGSHAYCLGPVTIGDRVSISQNVHLCAGTHDYTQPDMPLLRPPITVKDDAWLAADAFVGPNVTVGEGAILGARGCAFADLEPWTIYGGNPAIAIKPRAYRVGADGVAT
jgi:putative colanic acid biosynthesis acetyltransferase WcaF